MMREKLKVAAEKLRLICNPRDFHFKDTSEVPPIKGFIGQERAVEAIEFGSEVDNPDYNIFATGFAGKGKKMAVLRESVEKIAKKRMATSDFVLQDICCLYNFEELDRPKVVFFENGKGRKFRRKMEETLSDIRSGLPDLFRSKAYLGAKETISSKLAAEVGLLLVRLRIEAEKVGLIFAANPNGYSIDISSKETGQDKKPKLMPQEEYDNLPGAEKERLDKARGSIEKLAKKVSQKIHDLEAEANKDLKLLEGSTVKIFLDFIFQDLYKEYSASEKVMNYLRWLEEYVLYNPELFAPQQINGFAQPADNFSLALKKEWENNSSLPFEVNVLVDNSGKSVPPVIFESNPSFLKLFCEIEKKPVLGSYFTDHTCLKAGSLLQANGGYLILDVRDVLEEPGVWQKLKKTLSQQIMEFEEPLSGFGIVSALHPEPIPVNLKVIAVGESHLYDLLIKYDPEFLSVFKVKAQFDSEMPLNREGQKDYAGFVSLCCQRENLLPFDPTGVAKIVEQGSRLADSQSKLSTRLDEIKDLLIESAYWAKKAGSPAVNAEHVKKALEAQRLRLNLSEEKIQEFVKDGIYLITTQGEKVGQINGLAVHSLGDYSFGIPMRITAKTFRGQKGIISIDKEVKMSGPIHNKGVHIFSGYFNAEYGKYHKISFSASICFEQSYHGTEGDSASAAELFCLISSLSEVPIIQGIAVTGSVNQNGEIQPIGGVNEKIEGFFDICQKQGLTGEQGVIIPHQNVQNLMLRDDVVEACASGKFRVYAIKTVNEGIEILTGISADAIDKKVRKRLWEMEDKKEN